MVPCKFWIHLVFVRKITLKFKLFKFSAIFDFFAILVNFAILFYIILLIIELLLFLPKSMQLFGWGNFCWSLHFRILCNVCLKWVHKNTKYQLEKKDASGWKQLQVMHQKDFVSHADRNFKYQWMAYAKSNSMRGDSYTQEILAKLETKDIDFNRRGSEPHSVTKWKDCYTFRASLNSWNH